MQTCMVNLNDVTINCQELTKLFDLLCWKVMHNNDLTEAAQSRSSKDMLPRENVLDFNLLKCHSLCFRVSRTGYWPGFKINVWKIYCYFEKFIQFSKVSPFNVKRWKSVWIRACAAR